MGVTWCGCFCLLGLVSRNRAVFGHDFVDGKHVLGMATAKFVGKNGNRRARKWMNKAMRRCVWCMNATADTELLAGSLIHPYACFLARLAHERTVWCNVYCLI